MLNSIESKYRDLLNRLGVNGHDGAIAEIAALRETAGLDKPDNDVQPITLPDSPAIEATPDASRAGR